MAALAPLLHQGDRLRPIFEPLDQGSGKGSQPSRVHSRGVGPKHILRVVEVLSISRGERMSSLSESLEEDGIPHRSWGRCGYCSGLRVEELEGVGPSCPTNAG